jgi:hypothetical protein
MAFRQRLKIGLALAIGMTAGYVARDVQTFGSRSVRFVPSDTNTIRLESTGANPIRMSFAGTVIEARHIRVFDAGGFAVANDGVATAAPSK